MADITMKSTWFSDKSLKLFFMLLACLAAALLFAGCAPQDLLMHDNSPYAISVEVQYVGRDGPIMKEDAGNIKPGDSKVFIVPQNC
jgi:hypothetical protein